MRIEIHLYDDDGKRYAKSYEIEPRKYELQTVLSVLAAHFSGIRSDVEYTNDGERALNGTRKSLLAVR